MRSHNHNEAITHLAMPERAIPVLLKCEATKRDGFTALHDVSPTSVSVCRIPKTALRSFLDPQERKLFETKYGTVPERERDWVLYVLGLADALARRDARAMRGVVRRYVRDSKYSDIAWDEVRKSPLYELHRNLNRGIQWTRFVVWWAERERRLAPGLMAQDAAGALAALVLSSIGQLGGLGICQRPQCQKPFIRVRGGSKQRYCSYRCQSAAGMARFRARGKRKLRRRR
jgi:predicted RNA-binding Zn ribbon-like protein